MCSSNVTVLEVVERRDRNGRRSVECLVHFQGWNSGWDRYVVEDQILEYSEANRKLQRALAEKFLPPGVIDRRRYSAADSQRSSSVGAASTAASEPDSGDEPEPEAPPSAVHIELPAPLRRRLDDDYYYVNKYHKLLPLPCPTTVVAVLEAYVHHWQQTGRRHPPHAARSKAKDTWWEAAVCSVNLCKEAVDGLRITFDHVVGSQLLYASEREQHGRWLAPGGAAPEERARHASVRSDRTDESASRMTLRSRRHPRHDSESADCAASSDDEQPDCKRRLLSSESSTTDRAAWSLLPPSELNRNPPLPCCVYGPTHLLRLLALLPEILLHMHMSERKLNLVVHHVTLLLAFLQENAEQLFPKSRYR
ncbi:putative male-specific lethal-3 protein-like 2 [Pollicipes pollicipes]|uniref:putative male-specific lethal-3 protein-like 2 n=1 Tax=Pollicipes pollicipes TaxID=41117 RepID=UPI0018849749|nr:putative male-specific lethal-3 protein-like 2 [Pollicipes pollicipes]